MTDEPNIHVELQQLASDDPNQPEHARAFSYWIQNDVFTGDSVLDAVATAAARASGPDRRTSHVAVLGYAAHFDRKFTGAFVEGLRWLQERRYFVVGRPRTFEADGLALLGVAVGVSLLPTRDAGQSHAWLADLVRRSLVDAAAIDWNGSLISAASVVLKLQTNSRPLPELLVALQAKGLAEATADQRQEGWRHAFDVRGNEDGMSRASTRVAVINFLSRDAPAIRFDKASVTDVARVLHGLERSLRHWTWEDKPRTPKSQVARWDVENEYHVQNLLWALLAPIFSDLDDEEWLKSLGQHHPRGDLAIPSLRTIVEAKFLRVGSGQFSKVIQEVAADATTYLGDGSGYDHLIAVVWDDLARTEEHAELRRGLLALRGINDAIILSRPSFMRRIPLALKKKLDGEAEEKVEET
ncbi:hypothetical protein [Mesorhizobium sp. M0139]|uniref:PD-(D/E)XK nuclease domain-containing protein n=1 Tax=Mesorhizobium sp. M0139 TaxID=2956892 RepID=UPI00333CA741